MTTTAQPVLDMTLRPTGQDQALAAVPQSEPMNLATILNGLALNPDVPVDKLEKIIELHERVQANAAKAEFDEAFAAMQKQIPVIIEHGKTDKGRYATLEDIVETIRPILSQHGFSLSHRTEWPDKGTVKVIGVLAHKRGHERQSEFLSAADSSGSKNAIQGLGSAISYGRRYTVNDLLNIVTRNQDDDAKRAAMAPEPEGYGDWLAALSMKANEGLSALQAMWKVANTDPDLKAFAAHLTRTEPETWNELKKRAAKVVSK